MSKSVERLINLAVNVVGSQDEVAKLMKQPNTVISDWKRGRRNINSERVAELARLAGEPEDKWVALVAVEKTQNEGAKSWLMQLVAQAGVTIAIAATTQILFDIIYIISSV